MAIYHITYQTENYYTNPVREAVIELMVLPENSIDQHCISFEVKNSLEVNPQFSTSLYGASLIRFTVPSKFCTFNVVVNAVVEKSSLNPFDINGLLPEAQQMILDDFAFQIDNFRYLSLNEYTSPQKEKLPEDFMRKTKEDLFSYMQRVNNWIHQYIIYQSGITTTRTTLDEVLRLKAGVCQDQAHLFIAIMRANHIPARYVSGYLNQGSAFVGNIAMHAWAEVYLPGAGWIGFDPTNKLLADVNYIKVGHGLDYTDCMPIRGIMVSKGLGTSEYKVTITEQQNQ